MREQVALALSDSNYLTLSIRDREKTRVSARYHKSNSRSRGYHE
jgi:hypothetical protein